MRVTAFWAAIVGLVAALAQGLVAAAAWRTDPHATPELVATAAQTLFTALLAVVLFFIAFTGRTRREPSHDSAE